MTTYAFTFCPSDGKFYNGSTVLSGFAPELIYGEKPTWTITLKGQSASGITSWCVAVDKDYLKDTNVMVRTQSGITAVTSGDDTVLTVPLDTVTTRFLEVINGRNELPAVMGIYGIDTNATQVFYTQFRIKCLFTVDPGMSGTVEPVSVSSMTKAQMDARYALKGETQTPAFANITGQPTDNTNLASALDEKITSPSGGAYGQYLQKTQGGVAWGTPSGGGDMLKEIYDTDDDGVVDSAEEATKLSTARSIGNATFDGTANITLPDIIGASGVQKANLATDVQTSLEKADTALQTETYTGTITGIVMNSESKGNAGVVDLGNVVTDVSDKANADDLTAHTENSNIHVPITGTNGYVLTKTASGSEWQPGGSASSVAFSAITGQPTDNANLASALGSKAEATDLTTHTDNADIHVTASDKTAWNAKYDKEDTGIPKTDLAVSVQTSLGLADTALQTHQDISGKANASDLTDHTENSSIHVTAGDKTAWGAKYDKPSTGIPKTDMADGVQTSLGLADTAVQDASYVHTDNNYTTAEKTKLSGIEAGAEINVQADWDESDSGNDAYIKNKPEGLATETYVTNAVSAEATLRSSADALLVTKTTKVNGYELSSDVTITKSDVGLGNVDNTSDANKPVSTLQQAAIDAKYTKQPTGIPKTDLASDVQTSLGKADTALQEETYTGTITGITMNGASKGNSGVVDLGTVITAHQDISGKADASDLTSHTSDTAIHVTSGDKTTWSAKYTKPDTGIPKTDLAESVQTSLGLADTALQTEQYTGTITGITMNGASKGTSGVVDLGTVITAHQDISGKADASALTSHTSNTSIHVTSSDKTAWNGKQNAHSVASGNLLKSGGTGVISAATAGTDYLAVSHNTNSSAHSSLFSAKADASTLTAHTGSSAIHVPTSGTAGQYLVKTSSGSQWQTLSVDVSTKMDKKVTVTSSADASLSISPASAYKWTLSEAGTLSLDANWETGKACDTMIDILPGSYSVTCSGALELADTLTASKVNHCVVRWDGEFARLYVVDTEEIGTITATAQTITGTVNTEMAIDISDYVTVSTGANPSFAVASGSTLPAGLTLGSDGYLEGTPTATSSAVVNVNVSARNCTTVTLVLTFNITSGGAESGNYTFYSDPSSSPASDYNGTYAYDSSTNIAVFDYNPGLMKYRLIYMEAYGYWDIQMGVTEDGGVTWNWSSKQCHYTATSSFADIVGTHTWVDTQYSMNCEVTITKA